MKDLTKDSIAGHIVTLAMPVAIGMVTQMAYQLVDLYFVSRISDAATAGLTAAGSAMTIVLALTQVLSVGTAALISHAVGRKDQEEAVLLFNQSVALSVACGIVIMLVMSFLMRLYLQAVAADVATLDAGFAFFVWLLPGLLLMFPMTAFASALRGTGIVQPTVVISMITVMLNAIFAPMLIAGIGTGVVLGVRGAGLATSLSVLVGTVLMILYFHHFERYVSFRASLTVPRFNQWRRILSIGLPAGGEFALLFLFTATMYYVTRALGAPAQAGVGIGSRVLQAILLPAMAIAFAAGPIAGQNFGAGLHGRVRETFRKVTYMSTAVLLAATLFAQWRPEAFVRMFHADPSAVVVATSFIQVISWSFIAEGLVFTCSGMFQALGNTLPSLLSTGVRVLAFALPALWVSSRPAFHIEQVFYLSVASVVVQAALSLWLMHLQFRKGLLPISPALVTTAD